MRILKFLLFIFFPPLFLPAASSGQPPTTASPAPIILAQKKPYDLGNCFRLGGCKGDSIGMMWIDLPDHCKSFGGRSWMDQYGQCHELPEGPNNIQGP